MEAPRLGLYGASKHGVIGLMRSLRCTLPASHQINVCAVCPWMTATAMVRETRDQWIHAGLPMNQPEDVASIVVGLAAAGAGANGKAIYVEGGRGWDIEEGLDRTRHEWLGKQQNRTWLEGQMLLSDSTGAFAAFNGR